MKSLQFVITVILSLSGFVFSGKQAGEYGELKKSIKAFYQAGDSGDDGKLDILLNPQFRVATVMDPAKGLSIIDKQTYLSLIQSGTIGGKPRKLKIISISENGSLGHAEVKAESEELIFHSRLSWVKVDGNWQLVQDFPMVSPKK